MVDPFSKRSSGEENHRIKYGASCMQGNRDSMQDAHTAILELGSDSTSFFGVYDGHGGDKVALHCSELLDVYRIDENLRSSDKSMKSHSPRKGNLLSCLGTCLCSWARKKKPHIAPQAEGTTACVALIRGNQITVGNAGDSRCVLSKNGQAMDLSTDHKPDDPVESARIEAAGGQVIRKEIVKMRDGRRVIEQDVPRIDGKISVSRALGDFHYKQNSQLALDQQKMICNPDIRTENITDDIDFLLIASDGIWHEMSSEEVVDFVRRRLGHTNLSVICERLIERCIPSGDNSTVILVQFKNEARISSSLSSPRAQVINPADAGSSSPSCRLPQANITGESKADTKTEITNDEE